MGAVTAVGGTALGAGIGYVVGGRTGAVVGGLLGAVGGYNVEPLSDTIATRGAVRPAPKFATSGVARAGDSGRAAAVGGGDELHAVYVERLRAIGYDPSAAMAPSQNGDPWGSFRVRRSLDWELGALSMLPADAEAPVRAVGAGLTFGVSELLVQAIGASRRQAVTDSIARYPNLLVWSPDYPPATWPYRGGVQVDTGAPFGDADRARQIALYGPTPADVETAVSRRAYVGQFNGRRLVASLDELQGEPGAWGFRVV